MKKKMLILVGLILIFNISLGYTKIYDLKSAKQPISSGVTYQKIERFAKEGFITINVIEADLTNEYVKVDMLTPSAGMYNLGTVGSQAKANNAVAAVNSDFFTWVGSGKGSPLGFSMSDGKVTSTAYYGNADKEMMATFSLNKLNVPFYQYVKDINIEVINETGDKVRLGAINKASNDFLAPVLYTREWNTKSFGNTTKNYDTVELVVKNDEVIEIRNCAEPVEIPQDGYVITARGDSAYSLKTLFPVGAKIKLNVETQADMSDMLMAISGGGLLVKNGEIITNFSHTITGYNPRTALGTSADNKTLYIVAVDGRGESKGVTQLELAYLMNELGCNNAINLDGGGSTNMVGRLSGESDIKTLNNPTENRKVVNTLGILSTAPKGEADTLLISADKYQVFPNKQVALTVKGYDEYFNTAYIDNNAISWDVNGVLGNVTNNIFTPKGYGEATLTAKYNGAEGSITIRVLGEIGAIDTQVSKVTLAVGGSYTLYPIVRDKEGYTAEYDKSNFTYTASNNNCSISKSGVITANNIGETLVTVMAGGQKSFVHVIIGGGQEKVIDSFETASGYFYGYPTDIVTGAVNLINVVKHDGANSLKLGYDFTKSTEVRGAYIKFNTPPTIDIGINKINFWAYSPKKQPNISIKMQIADTNGNEKLVIIKDKIDFDNWTKLSYDLSGIVLPAKLQRIYVAQASGTGEDSYICIDELSFTGVGETYGSKIKVPKNTIIKDDMEKTVEENSDNVTFIFNKSLVSSSTLYGTIKTNRLKKAIKNVDFVLTKNGAINGIDNIVTTQIDNIYSFSNIDVIMLNNTNGLTKDQWLWFVEKMNSLTNKNLFIVLNSNIKNVNSSKKEQQIFEELLAEQKNKGKNVTVLYYGDKTAYSMYNGIRQISVDASLYDGIGSKVDSDEYIKFVVGDDDISYQILSIYE